MKILLDGDLYDESAIALIRRLRSPIEDSRGGEPRTHIVVFKSEYAGLKTYISEAAAEEAIKQLANKVTVDDESDG